MSLKVPLAILTVFIGCASNVVFLELLVQYDPGVGNLVTFSSFLFITVEGLIFTSKFGKVSPKVPMSAYTTLVIMYFVVSVVNNYALNFDIPMPLHIIFRAGSLIANMFMGMVILKRRYSMTKYLAVLGISVGVCLCTFMSSKSLDNGEIDEDGGVVRFLTFVMGIGMLIFALLMSARMGIYQEVIYRTHGKHPKEALFYSHCLPLPGFLILSKDLYNHFGILMASTPIVILGFHIPVQLVYLIFNVLTQYICISAVFVLTTECTSLTVTLVLTLRKFLSLLFSIWYFNNPFTIYHWLGTLFVFSGTLAFSLVKDTPKAVEEKDSKKTD